MLRVHRPERGASVTEYAGVLIVVAAVIIGVITSGLHTRVSGTLARALDCISGEAENCPTGSEQASENLSADQPEGAPADGEQGSPTPDTSGEGPEPASDPQAADPDANGGENVAYQTRGEDEAPRRSYECGSWQLVCDWGQGAVSEVNDIVVDALEGAQGTACLAHICTNDDFRATWGGVRDSAVQWFTDPQGAAEDTYQAWADGPIEDHNNAYEDRSTARTVVLGVASVFGFGMTRFLPNIPEGGSTRDHRQNAESAALDGNASAAQRYADQAEQAAQESERAARANPDDHDLQDQAERDRRNADEATRAIPVAQARETLISTPSGRELNRVLNENGVMVVFEDMAHHNGMFEGGGNNTIVINSDLAGTPQAAVTLAHEASHARDTSSLPTHQEATRDEFVDARIQDESNARITGYQVARELREEGHDIPMERDERRYNAMYEDRVEMFEEEGHSRSEAESLAEERTAQDFGEHFIADMDTSNGTTYREVFENTYDSLTGE